MDISTNICFDIPNALKTKLSCPWAAAIAKIVSIFRLMVRASWSDSLSSGGRCSSLLAEQAMQAIVYGVSKKGYPSFSGPRNTVIPEV